MSTLSTTAFTPNLSLFTESNQGVKHLVPLQSLSLENGQFLADYTLAFQFWGVPNAENNNFILIEHALTANSHVTSHSHHPDSAHRGWWEEIVGPAKAIDTDKYCVIAINALGGCDGSTGPSSIYADGRAWGSRFPLISARDQVHAEWNLIQYLGIERFYAIIGGSMGGVRALEWMLLYPDFVERALILATSAKAQAYMIATQALQIEAITQDPYWAGGDYYDKPHKPSTGLSLARQIAHLTYRTHTELEERFSNRSQTEQSALSGGKFAVTSYLGHQADKLQARFDAGSYVILTHSLNTHDLGRDRGGVIAALASCQIPCIIAGIVEDQLFPIQEQRFLYENLPQAKGFYPIHSHKGHDGFMTETAAVSSIIQATLNIKI